MLHPPEMALRRPPSLNLGVYNILDGCGFGLPQVICDLEQGNYDLMISTETKILDVVYCHNLLGYELLLSQDTVTAARGAQWGIRMVSRERL